MSPPKTTVSQFSVTPLAVNGSDVQILSSSPEISTAVPGDLTAPASDENVASPDHPAYPPDQQLLRLAQPRLQDTHAAHPRTRLTPGTYQAPRSNLQAAGGSGSPLTHSPQNHPPRLRDLENPPRSSTSTHRRRDGPLFQHSQQAAFVESSTASIQHPHLTPAHELVGREPNSLAMDVVTRQIEGSSAPPYPVTQLNELQSSGLPLPSTVLFPAQYIPNHAMPFNHPPSTVVPSLDPVPGTPDPPLTFTSLRTHHPAGDPITATPSLAETEDDPDISMDYDSDTEIASVASPPPARGNMREGETGKRYRLNEKNARVRKANSVSDLRLEIFGRPPEPAEGETEGKKKRQPGIHKTCDAALYCIRYLKWENAGLRQELAQSKRAQTELGQSLDQANQLTDSWRQRAEQAERAPRTTAYSEGWNVFQHVPSSVEAHSNIAQPEHELYGGNDPPTEYNNSFLGANEWLAQSADDKTGLQNFDDVVSHQAAQF